jgi:hypothetical protein
MPRRNQRRQAPLRSRLAALVVIISLAAAVAGILGYLKLPTHWPWEKQEPALYGGDLSKPNEAIGFSRFLAEHEHQVVRLNLYVPVEQDLPDGSTSPINIDWEKGDIKAFALDVDCLISEGEQICEILRVQFVASEGIEPDFGRVSAGYFSVLGIMRYSLSVKV